LHLSEQRGKFGESDNLRRKKVNMANLKAAALADKGMLREMNEDSVLAMVVDQPENDSLGLFVVCDGMGGHMGGEFASYWAVEAIKSEFSGVLALTDPRDTLILQEEDRLKAQAGILPDFIAHPDHPAPEELVNAAVQKANQVVYDYTVHKPEKAGNAGTTVSMVFVKGDQAICANAGDSRTYLLRDHQLRQVSRDHSLVATLVANGELKPEEVYTHPRRSVIFRYLGMKGHAQPDVFIEELKPGDYLLLCTDGLWEMVRQDKEIVSRIEAANDPEQACISLIEAANQAGGEDNIGVVVVKIQ
jgi:PPM family protein phosphatase